MSHDVDPQGQCVHMSKGFDPVGWDVVEGRMAECSHRRPEHYATNRRAEFGFGSRPRLAGAYQRDWAMVPPCSVCVLQLPSISTIAPKSLQDSWDRRQ
jgi:hypothetical protein